MGAARASMKHIAVCLRWVSPTAAVAELLSLRESVDVSWSAVTIQMARCSRDTCITLIIVHASLTPIVMP